MKILMATESFRIGGKERRLLELLKRLALSEYYECEIVLFKDIIDFKEVKLLPYKIHVIERKVKKDLSGFFKLRKIYKSFKPDIVHAWGGMASVYSLPMAKLMGFKTVNSMITNASPVKMFREHWNRSRLTFPFSDVVLSNSKAGLRAYNAPYKKSEVIYNGFNFNRLLNLDLPSVVREQYGITTSKVVGMIASISARKDYASYITAAKKFLETNGDVTFIIAGDGKGINELKRMVPSRFANQILFLGKVKKVESLIQILTVGVLTTNQRIHGEGISNSILECMAQGKPVIATKGGGSTEIIVNNETGYLIDEAAPDQLCDKLEILLSDEFTCDKMGEKGAERIKKKFSIEIMTDKFKGIYNELVE